MLKCNSSKLYTINVPFIWYKCQKIIVFQKQFTYEMAIFQMAYKIYLKWHTSKSYVI